MKKLFMAIAFMLVGILAFAQEFSTPATLTSVGQSADVQMVKVLLKKAGVKAKFDKVIKADGLADEKTLILAIGGSSKGLGAAGIKVEDELARVEKLIQAAKEKNIKILALHIGGEARRGELSDKFVYVAAPYCDYLIVVEEGNRDGAFTKIADEKQIPIEIVGKITETIAPLKRVFQ